MNTKQRLEVMKEIETANKRHVEEWKQKDSMQNFYFTFGTDPQFPFGYHDYVLIRCADAEQACKLFDAMHKPQHEGLMNCAFMYSEAQWEKNVKIHYKGREPAELIVVSRPGSR